MKKLILFIIGVGIISFIYGRQPQDPIKTAVLRGPASVRSRIQGKVGGAFTVEIRSLVPVVARAGDPIVLEASITSRRDVDQVDFDWNLPPGIVAQSTSEGSLGPLNAGEQRTIMLHAISQTDGNKQIHLHVFRTVAGERSGVTRQYNTRDEEIIAQKIQARAELLEQRESKSGVRLRITQ